MTERAYLKLLDKARCTVNFCAPNPYFNRRALPINQRVEFIIRRLTAFGIRGYSPQYIRQLVVENSKEGKEMKCWECKRKVTKATRIPYTDGVEEKFRDVCGDCLKLLNFNMCHFVEVERITRRQIRKEKQCLKVY